jgi:uncharacterized membrane protein YfhO
MPVLMMALVTCIAIEDPKIDFKHGLKWTAVITLAFVGAIGLIPKMNGTKITGIGLEDDPLRFWAYVGIVVLGLTFVWVIYNKHGKNPAAFANSATIALTIIICIYGNFFIATGKEFGYDGSYFKQVAIDGAQNIKKDTSEFNRIDTPNSLDNQGMFWNWPTIYAFQSVVPPSIMEFYSAIGVQRDVASRPDTSFKGLRPFLSVKYLFDTSDAKTLNTPGWTYDGEQLGYSEFKDENFIPMGYTFDNYINEYEFDASPYKDQILLKGILLNDKQIEKYGNLFTKLDETDILYSDEEIASDAAARRSEACSTFTTDNAGFTSTINLSKDNLVFFTVPYDSGWTATVNGKKADIEKVDVGFMAVEGNKGNNTIRFVYTTPGLSTGLKVTIVSFGVVLLYLLIIFYLAVRKKKRALVVNQSNENILEELSEHTVNSDEANSDINEE